MLKYSMHLLGDNSYSADVVIFFLIMLIYIIVAPLWLINYSIPRLQDEKSKLKLGIFSFTIMFLMVGATIYFDTRLTAWMSSNKEGNNVILEIIFYLLFALIWLSWGLYYNYRLYKIAIKKMPFGEMKKNEPLNVYLDRSYIYGTTQAFLLMGSICAGLALSGIILPVAEKQTNDILGLTIGIFNLLVLFVFPFILYLKLRTWPRNKIIKLRFKDTK